MNVGDLVKWDWALGADHWERGGQKVQDDDEVARVQLF